jgi:hypothetical protein
MSILPENVEDWSLQDFIEDLKGAAKTGVYYEIPPEYAAKLAELIEEVLP